MTSSPGAGSAISHKNDPSIPAMRSRQFDDPAGYIPDANLLEAIRVALLLDQPLLLTGEPGTGKTQVASYVAWALQQAGGPLRRHVHGTVAPYPLMFETKSTSTSRDLFYTYDTVARFHAAQTGEGSKRSADYITYNAVGRAILHAHEEEEIRPWLSPDFVHTGKQRFVVLIDEIDKAPRDFPNDILNEIEGMYFRVPELQNKIFRAPEEYRPILILTSNSERNLPDAFLRRCAYHHIAFPDRERLIQIVESRLPGSASARAAGAGDTTGGPVSESILEAPMVQDALNLFYEFRDRAGLQKKPATAEFLGWLRVLLATNSSPWEPIRDAVDPDYLRATLCVLIKTNDDLPKSRRVLDNWLANRA